MRLLISAAFVAPLFAQPEIPTTVQGSVARTLDFVDDQFISIAEAMPETKYTFVPTAG